MFEDLKQVGTTDNTVDITTCTNDELRLIVELLLAQMNLSVVRGQRKGWDNVLMLRRNE